MRTRICLFKNDKIKNFVLEVLLLDEIEINRLLIVSICFVWDRIGAKYSLNTRAVYRNWSIYVTLIVKYFMIILENVIFI